MAKNVDWTGWHVQLAYNYTGKELHGQWFSLSQKINGVRATYFADEMVSRSGKNIRGLDEMKGELTHLINWVKQTFGFYPVFDGELRIADIFAKDIGDDNAVFKASVGIVNSINDLSEKYKLTFTIFDVLSSPSFATEAPWLDYKKRREQLVAIDCWVRQHSLNHVKVVPLLYEGTDVSQIDKQLEFAEANNWEGIMINLNSDYIYRRTPTLLKVKKFKTIDLKIVGYTRGTGKYEHTLGAILCEFDGNIVGIGTGFDDITRDLLWAKGDHLEGKICEVKYKDITCDKHTGLRSLQFPVFQGIKTDKTEADRWL